MQLIKLEFVIVKKILIVVHQATSDPGLVGQLLQAEGYSLDVRCPAEGDSLPAQLEAYSGVVVFGGPMSANDSDTLPFIRSELDWIPKVLAAEKPYLGICLGAQLLARVLGAAVQPHPTGVREIGYTSIQPSCVSHNPFAALSQVYQWHQEGFELPAGAVLLATGEIFPNQAFRYGEQVYGVQFHPEMTRHLIQQWTERGADQLTDADPTCEEQLAAHDRHAVAVARWLRGFLHDWLSPALELPAGKLSA